jgi:protocatechuate 3,4-dioxygenase beta subunit
MSHVIRRRVQRLVAASALGATSLVAAAQQPARDARRTLPVGTAAISGTVVADEPGNAPVRRVTLTLSSASTGVLPFQFMAMTDDRGRFAFTRLAAGSYSSLRATRPGFVDATYGEKRIGGIGTPITLADGQSLTVALKLRRGAVITGVVSDPQGRPMADVEVEATPVRQADGKILPGSRGMLRRASTDDRGVYRVFSLAPGEYIVGALVRGRIARDAHRMTEAEIRWAQQQLQPGSGPASAAPPPSPAMSHRPVYYPGTPDASGATVVTMTAGQERSGVDFSIEPVTTSRVEGRILNPDGQPAQGVTINMVARNSADGVGSSLLALESSAAMRPTVSAGRFSIPGVLPGEYTIAARTIPRAGQRGGAVGGAPNVLWALTDVTVSGGDVSDLELRLQPAMSVTGKVVVERTSTTPLDLTRGTIRLTAAPSTTAVTVTVGSSSASIQDDGTFTIPGVSPGRYLITGSIPAAAGGTPLLLKSARVAGADAADAGFDVRPSQDVTDAIVTFTDRSAELTGTLVDAAGRRTPDFSIALYPADKAMWSQRSRRMRAPVRTSTEGKFRFTGLLPGEYYLAALTDFEPGEFYTPAFIEQVVAGGAIKIVIAEGEKQVQDLKIAGGH